MGGFLQGFPTEWIRIFVSHFPKDSLRLHLLLSPAITSYPHHQHQHLTLHSIHSPPFLQATHRAHGDHFAFLDFSSFYFPALHYLTSNCAPTTCMPCSMLWCQLFHYILHSPSWMMMKNLAFVSSSKENKLVFCDQGSFLMQASWLVVVQVLLLPYPNLKVVSKATSAQHGGWASHATAQAWFPRPWGSEFSNPAFCDFWTFLNINGTVESSLDCWMFVWCLPRGRERERAWPLN